MTRHYGSKQLSSPKARAAVAQLLAGCTLEALAKHTPESLAGSWNVSIADAADMLQRARRMRMGRVL